MVTVVSIRPCSGAALALRCGDCQRATLRHGRLEHRLLVCVSACPTGRSQPGRGIAVPRGGGAGGGPGQSIYSCGMNAMAMPLRQNAAPHRIDAAARVARTAVSTPTVSPNKALPAVSLIIGRMQECEQAATRTLPRCRHTCALGRDVGLFRTLRITCLQQESAGTGCWRGLMVALGGAAYASLCPLPRGADDDHVHFAQRALDQEPTMSRAGRGNYHEKDPATPAGTADTDVKRRDGKTARARRAHAFR